MSLATALAALPDDRASRQAVREVLSYFSSHRREPVAPAQLTSVTGRSLVEIEPVVGALADAFVIDCQPDVGSCVYDPDIAVATEVDRFLFTSERSHDRFRGDVERFRGSYSRRR